MKTGDTEHVDIAALKIWLSAARPGHQIIYALGDIASDRGLPYRWPSTALDAVARQIMEWQSKGLVHVVQRRNPPLGFAYIAQRSAQPQKLS